MALINQNPDLQRRLQEILGIKDTALAVVPITPEQRVIINDELLHDVSSRSATRTSTGTTTIFTSDSSRNTWLTHIVLSMSGANSV